MNNTFPACPDEPGQKFQDARQAAKLDCLQKLGQAKAQGLDIKAVVMEEVKTIQERIQAVEGLGSIDHNHPDLVRYRARLRALYELTLGREAQFPFVV